MIFPVLKTEETTSLVTQLLHFTAAPALTPGTRSPAEAFQRSSDMKTSGERPSASIMSVSSSLPLGN